MAILFVGNSSAYETCSTKADIHSNGRVDVTFQWTISADSGYYYPANGRWVFGIPRQAENIKVQNKGEKLAFGIEENNGFQKELWMENDERISDNEYYTFNVTYTSPRGATVFEDTIFFERSFAVFCEDGNTVKIAIPSETNVASSSVDYSRERDVLGIPNLLNGEQVTLYLESNDRLTNNVRFDSGIFQVTTPQVYSEFIMNQTQEVNSYLSELESQTGIEPPKSLNLTYVGPNSTNLSMDTAGAYSDGEIRITSKELSRARIASFETLLHEMVHAFNEDVRGNASDWWWEEGTAEYVAYQVMENHGYNTSVFRYREIAINKTFEDCTYERSFIGKWNPVSDDEFAVEPLNPCGTETVSIGGTSIETAKTSSGNVDYITDKDKLGYSYSAHLVKELSAIDSDVVSDVHRSMRNQGVTIAESFDQRNNQINFFTSQAIGKDLTSFFNRRGIYSASWEEGWEELEQTNQTLSRYEESTKYTIYEPERTRLQDAYYTFYMGNFSQARNQAQVALESVQKVNQSYTESIRFYRNISETIASLENREEPRFYEKSQKLLNESLGFIKDRKFDKGSQKIQEARSTALSRREKIEKYQNLTSAVEDDIHSKSFPASLFLSGSKESLNASKSAYSNGNINNALEQAKLSQKQENRAPIKAGLLLLLILVGGTAAYTRRETIQSILR